MGDVARPPTDLAILALKLRAALGSGTDPECHQKKVQQLMQIEREHRIQDVQILNEINILKEVHSHEIRRVRIRQEQITADYKEFMESIADMKSKISAKFPALPRPMVLLIHYHASQMVDGLWQQSDERLRNVSKENLGKFLTLVYEDSVQAVADESNAALPMRVLETVIGRNLDT